MKLIHRLFLIRRDIMKEIKMYSILLIVAAVMTLHCKTSTVIRQEDSEKTNTVNYAKRTGFPVALMNFLEKVAFKEVIIDKGDTNYVVDRKTNKRDYLNPINVKYVFVLGHGYVNKINYITSNGNYPLEFLAKSINGATLLTESKINAEVLLSDKTRILGRIGSIDFERGDIVIQSKLRDFNLTKNVISEIKMSMNEVKLILIDGTERRGGIIKDDGNEITIRTILGDEKYNRRKIHKIIYHD